MRPSLAGRIIAGKRGLDSPSGYQAMISRLNSSCWMSCRCDNVVNTVPYGTRVLKDHRLFHCNPLMLSTVMLKAHPTAVPLRTRALPLYPSLTASAISVEQRRSLAPAAHRIL